MLGAKWSVKLTISDSSQFQVINLISKVKGLIWSAISEISPLLTVEEYQITIDNQITSRETHRHSSTKNSLDPPPPPNRAEYLRGKLKILIPFNTFDFRYKIMCEYLFPGERVKQPKQNESMGKWYLCVQKDSHIDSFLQCPKLRPL